MNETPRREQRQRLQSLGKRHAILVGCLLLPTTHLAADTFTVNDNGDIPPGQFDPNDGIVTLREAVERANANNGQDVIDFSPATTGTIALDYGALSLEDDVRVLGPGSSHLAVSGQGVSRVWFVSAGIVAKIRRLTIRDGQAVDFGGGIWNDGHLELRRCRVTANVATSDELDTSFGGGGIENRGRLDVHSCTLDANVVVGEHEIFEDIANGGGAINSTGELRIYGSSILDNEAFNAGGIRVSEGTLDMEGCVVADNVAHGIVGGGMTVVLSEASIRNSHILANEALGPFGNSAGISNDSSITTLDRVVLAGNVASGFGGGVTIAPVQEGGSSSVTARRCLIQGNQAAFGGGFAVVDGNTLNLSGCVLRENHSFVDGGGVWVGNFLGGFGNSVVQATGSLFISNSTDGRGGAFFVQVADSLTLDFVLITLNHAAQNGGGLYLEETPPGFDPSLAIVIHNTPDDIFQE